MYIFLFFVNSTDIYLVSSVLGLVGPSPHTSPSAGVRSLGGWAVCDPCFDLVTVTLSECAHDSRSVLEAYS